jgi:pimeloyl-ACP methyl ester carboxylesterase
MSWRIRATSYDDPVRRRLLPVLCAAVLVAACGDGVHEGVQERSPRGTIEGVVLAPPESVETSAPTTTPDTDAPSTTDSVPDTAPRQPGDDVFRWHSVQDGVDDGFIDVPLDWSKPKGDQITLYLVRHRAVDTAHRIGTLLVNPGGPGYGGSGLAYDAESIYGQDLLDRFDIIGWDPRGTGYSDPTINCIDDYDKYVGIDTSPDTDAERTLLVDRSTEFADACATKNTVLLPHVGTADTARDMNAIREALEEPTISYFGFSYGSELGATWATMFPDTVRAMVIDGAVDPTVDYFEQNVQQAAGIETAFDQFLARCSDDTACAFHNNGDAAGAYDRLSAQADRDPVRTEAGRPSVTQGVLATAVAQAMYDEAAWPELEQALADLQDGDGTTVLGLYDHYYGRQDGRWDDSLEAYFAINCLDDPGSTGPDQLFARERELAAAAPRLGRSWLGELTMCSVWPGDPAPKVTITGKGAGPVLVVGTTGDAITPLASTRRMAAALEDGHLVVVDAVQHTGYGVNRCVDSTVDGYLVDPTAPLLDEIDCT